MNLMDFVCQGIPEKHRRTYAVGLALIIVWGMIQIFSGAWR